MSGSVQCAGACARDTRAHTLNVRWTARQRALLHSKTTFLQLGSFQWFHESEACRAPRTETVRRFACGLYAYCSFTVHTFTLNVTLGSAAHEYSPHSRAESEEVTRNCDKRGGYDGQMVMTAADSQAE